MAEGLVTKAVEAGEHKAAAPEASGNREKIDLDHRASEMGVGRMNSIGGRKSAAWDL